MTMRHFLLSTNTTTRLQSPWTPSPQRANNHNIMDDVTQLLPDADHKAINNVRLYLRITYLLEITDTSGTTILPHALEPGHSSTRLMLKWPQQPQPKPAAWIHWRKAIRNMYLQPISN